MVMCAYNLNWELGARASRVQGHPQPQASLGREGTLSKNKTQGYRELCLKIKQKKNINYPS